MYNIYYSTHQESSSFFVIKVVLGGVLACWVQPFIRLAFEMDNMHYLQQHIYPFLFTEEAGGEGLQPS